MNLLIDQAHEIETKKQTILIIDDNPTNLAILVEYLDKHNFDILIARNSTGGRTRARLIQPDLILLDIQLPDYDGFETCRYLKADPTTQDIPVIFITALANDIEQKVRGFQVGGVDYLTKPLQEAELLARIRTHLNLKNLTQHLHQQTIILEQEIAERKQAEQELQKHQEQLETLIQARTNDLQKTNEQLNLALKVGNLGVWDWDLINDQSAWSDNIEHIFGVKPGTFVGTYEAFLKIVHIDDQQRFKQAIQQAIEEGKNYHIEHRVVLTENEVRWLESRGQVFYDKNGQPTRIVGVIQVVTARKEAEEQLLYQANLLQNVSDAMIATDLQFNIQSWNKAAEKIYGWSADQVIGKKMSEVVPTLYPNHEREEVLTQFLNKGHWGGEVIQEARDGTLVNILSSVTLFKDSIGNPIGAVAVNRDITHYKQMEASLQESENRFQTLYIKTPVMMHSINAKTELLAVSNRWLETLGYAHHEVIGRQVTDFLTKESEERAKTTLERLWRQGYVNEIPYQFIKKNGDIIDILSSAITEFDVKNQAIRGFAVLIDVTERKRAETALRISEKRFKSAFRNAPIGMALVDPKGQFFQVNEMMSKIFGYSVEELLTHSIASVTYPDDLDKSLQKIEQALRGEITIFKIEKRYLRQDKQVIWTVTSAYLVRDNADNPQHFVTHIQDISEAKQAEYQIKASLQEKEVMLKEIHHRVKNNLQVISSLLSLQSEYISDKRINQLFKESQNRVKSMALIHEQLYQTQDLAQINFAQYVKTLTRHLFNSYRPLTTLISLQFELTNLLLTIEAAIPTGLIINELVSNALKHAFPGHREGIIQIKLEVDANQKIYLAVRDNGIGFPSDLDFQRTTSLGLTLVITLVKQINGTIELYQENGTEFRIIFTNLSAKQSLQTNIDKSY